MNQADFLARLGTLAKLCGVTLTTDIIEFYDKALRTEGYEKACRAIGHVIISRKGGERFPSIGDLIRLIRPVQDDSDLAIEAANRVVEAMTKFGWNNPGDAQKFLGEIGWYVVNRNGGWKALCENVQSRDIQIYRAQFRELALSAIRRHRLGLLDVTPDFNQIEGVKREALPSRLGDVVKQIGGTHETKQEGR